MTETQPIWRVAIKDPDHPLHSAAWTVFSSNMKPDKAAKRLEPNKDEIIPFFITILEEPTLANNDALGEGYAPIHVVELLVKWRVEAVIPHLFEIILDEEHREEPTYLWDMSVRYLPRFGPQVVPRLLELADQVPEEANLCLSIAADAEPGNTEVYQRTQTRLEATQDEWDIEYLASTLLKADLEQAVPYLRDLMKARKYPRELRRVIESNIEYHLEQNT